MSAIKRSGGDPIRSSDEIKRTRSLVSGDLYINQGILSGLRKEAALKLSKSVASLALSDGDTLLFSSSGIAIECTMDFTRFLTSASLFRALNNNNKTKNHDSLKIEVRYEGKVVPGVLEQYDLCLEIAVVKTKPSLDVEAVFLYHWCQFLPHCDVVSLGRDTSGKLMATTGKLTLDSTGTKDSEYIMFSTCELSEVWEGGPLFDYAGDFVGMNLVLSMKKSFFLPTSLIIARLQHFWTFQERKAFLTRVKDLKTVRVGEKLTDDTHYSQPGGAPVKDHLEVLGYPRPTGKGMTLVNTFEEYFGDVYCSGVWKQLRNRVRQKINQSVVSLASFNGGTRCFACSGIFIDWDGKCGDNECQTILTSACLVRNPEYPYIGDDKIVEGLRIEVLLPNKERREGTLVYYNLHYNVALVSVRGYSGVSHAIVKHGPVNRSSKSVAAVGRCFKSSDLLASIGKLARWSGPYDCRKLRYSTCRITKAGIGGPLIDYDGNFIGMNFYDPKVGTPFLFCDDIVDILDCFKKRTGAEVDNFRIDGDRSSFPSTWPVPVPCWRRPGDPDGIKEYERKILASGCQFRYRSGRILVGK